MTDQVDEQVQEQVEQELPAVALADLRPALEAVLMVADEPLDPAALATAVGHPTVEVVRALEGLATEYTEQRRGFELRNVAGGWRFYSRDEFATVVGDFVLDGQQSRLTQAALETLAVVAYKQPVSRARVSAIRGVNVDGVMRTLLTRGLIAEAGQDEETGANLYRTTSYFLERIGITDLDELPELAPYLPDLEDLEDELEKISEPMTAASEESAVPEPVVAEPVVADVVVDLPPSDEVEPLEVDEEPVIEEPEDEPDPVAYEPVAVEPEAEPETDDEPEVEAAPEAAAPDVPAIDLDNLPKPDEGPVEGRLKDQFPGLFG